MKPHSSGATLMSSMLSDLDLARALLERDELDAAKEIIQKVEKQQAAMQAAADDGAEQHDDDCEDIEDYIEQVDDDAEDEDDIVDNVAKLGPGKRIRYPGDRSHAGLSYPRDDLTDA